MEKVGKEEFIKDLQAALKEEGIDLSLESLDKILDMEITKIEENVVEGKSVEFVGFGKFLLQSRQARMTHDIQNGEEIKVVAHDDHVFEAGDVFKKMVK